jgi:hypothetical protein
MKRGRTVEQCQFQPRVFVGRRFNGPLGHSGRPFVKILFYAFNFPQRPAPISPRVASTDRLLKSPNASPEAIRTQALFISACSQKQTPAHHGPREPRSRRYWPARELAHGAARLAYHCTPKGQLQAWPCLTSVPRARPLLDDGGSAFRRVEMSAFLGTQMVFFNYRPKCRIPNTSRNLRRSVSGWPGSKSIQGTGGRFC